MKFLLILPVLAIGTPATAQSDAAAERALSAEFNDCMTKGEGAGGTTIGMMNCTGNEIAVQDARLNQAYTMALARLPASRKTALRVSERAWITRRDATCKRESDLMGGGTLSAVGYASCIMMETTKRRLWLETYR